MGHAGLTMLVRPADRTEGLAGPLHKEPLWPGTALREDLPGPPRRAKQDLSFAKDSDEADSGPTKSLADLTMRPIARGGPLHTSTSCHRLVFCEGCARWAGREVPHRPLDLDGRHARRDYCLPVVDEDRSFGDRVLGPCVGPSGSTTSGPSAC